MNTNELAKNIVMDRFEKICNTYNIAKSKGMSDFDALEETEKCFPLASQLLSRDHLHDVIKQILKIQDLK